MASGVQAMTSLLAWIQPHRPCQASSRPFAAGGAPPCARPLHLPWPGREMALLARRAQPPRYEPTPFARLPVFLPLQSLACSLSSPALPLVSKVNLMLNSLFSVISVSRSVSKGSRAKAKSPCRQGARPKCLCCRANPFSDLDFEHRESAVADRALAATGDASGNRAFY